MPRTKTASKKNSKKTSKKVSKPKKEPKLKVFCGISQPIPKGHKLGSMKECLELKQVRYYGLKKIDSKLADSINEKKESKSDLMIKIAGLRGKLSKLKKDIDNSTKMEEKRKIAEEFEIVRKQILSLNDKMQKMK
jgi:predicted  nucleic acid-binding Zn-ribbon protein